MGRTVVRSVAAVLECVDRQKNVIRYEVSAGMYGRTGTSQYGYF